MLSDEEIFNCDELIAFNAQLGLPTFMFGKLVRAIESAATAPLLARIAELEADCDRLERYWNEAMATHKNIAGLERQLAEARKDAELLDYIQTNGATVEIIPGAPDFYPVHFRVGGRYRTANENIRDAIRAAIKEQT